MIIDDLYKNRGIRIYKDVSPTIRSERTGLKTVEYISNENTTDFTDYIKQDEYVIEGAKPFTYASLFSGVGGFEFGLNRVGGQCVFASEVDKFATQSYKAIHGEDNLHGDVTKIDAKDVPDHDVLVGGFPCQAFSVAGHRGGFEDARGTLFFDIARIAKEKQPKFLLLENVKGLVGHDKGKTLDTIVKTLNDIGYRVDFEVLNSKYYGVPQNRERIFIVAIREDLIANEEWLNTKGQTVVPKGKRRISGYENVKTFNFNFPQNDEVVLRLRDVLEQTVDESFYLSEDKTSKLFKQLEYKEVKQNGVNRIAGLYGKSQAGSVYDPQGVCATLDTAGGGYREPIITEPLNPIEEDGEELSYKVRPTINTMQGGDRQPKIAIKGFKEIVRVRKYDVNKLELSELLRSSKKAARISNKEISDKLNVPVTKVEHWFRTDKSFAIPDPNVWFELKKILNITNNEHDEAITTFVSKESNFDTTNRIYDVEYLSPTLNTTSEPKIAAIGNTSNTGHRSHDVHDPNGISPTIAARDYKGAKQVAIPVCGLREPIRIRKLTPKECFRLQGFPDYVHDTLEEIGISNSQRYKQAGNAVTVNVIEALGKELIKWL